jgi:diacylglycerol O-acyltransferase
MDDGRLRHLDAGFLEAEDGDGHISMAIGALAVLQGPIPPFADILAVIAERSSRLPHSRDMVRTSRFDIWPPRWTPDDRFEIEHHVRRVAISPPGDRAALYRTAADLIERRLQRTRPLWEVWVIEGLSDGCWAMLIKIHHCIADGTVAAAMLNEICDGPGGSAKPLLVKLVPPTRPSFTLANPLTAAQRILLSGAGLVQSAIKIATGATQIITSAMSSAGSPLAETLTDMRRFSAASTPMRNVQLLCARYEVTVNDVALAAITDGFRSALQRRGLLRPAASMRTLVPVSVRSPEAMYVADNRVSIMLPSLPVELSDPLDQLRTVHQRLLTTKRSGQSQAGSLAVTLGNVIPFPVLASAVRLFIRLPQRGIVTLATNIHGPEEVLQFMGCRILAAVPVPPIIHGMQAGIAIMSYADELTFGIIGDFDAQIGAEELAGDIESGMGRLLAAAGCNQTV